MLTDIVDSQLLKLELGVAWGPLLQQFDRKFKDLLVLAPGASVAGTYGDGFLVSFLTVRAAIETALRLQYELARAPWEGPRLQARIGIELGAAPHTGPSVPSLPGLFGLAVALVARIQSVALPGQILLGPAAYEQAKVSLKQHPPNLQTGERPPLVWRSHGRHRFRGIEPGIELFEVGVKGIAPLAAPASRETSNRDVSLGPSTVPAPSAMFVSRADITAQIHQILNANSDFNVQRQVFVKAGAGYGKSAAASLYAEQYKTEYPGGRFFLNMYGGDMLHKLAMLVEPLGLPATNNPVADAAAVKARLESGPPSLLILDDVESKATWAALLKSGVVPRGSCRVLVTSRDEKLAPGDSITLGRLESAEAQELQSLLRLGTPAVPEVMPIVPTHLEHLHPLSDGCPPEWASAWGEDAFGPWVEFQFARPSEAPLSQRLRWIPPGRFMMGSPPDEPGRVEHEGPVHPVRLTSGFWLFETPCTQALWEAVMGADKNESRFKDPNRPVENVSWSDCQTFVERLGSLAPEPRLDLPTEAEWEYACRAGSTEATYAGPIRILGENNAPVLDDIAWYGGNCGVEFDLQDGYSASGWPKKQHHFNLGGTRQIGKKRPNPWGLHDMLGNVFEWCRDAQREYGPTEEPNPVGSEEASAYRTVRGGSWLSDARHVRAACRRANPPDERLDYLGFRCRVL